jgi:phosphohistidine phosphatase SixA
MTTDFVAESGDEPRKMMMIQRSALLAILLCVIIAPAHAQKAVYLVRHAEKAGDSGDPPLTDAGKQRAQALARHLQDAGITVIYTSDARRTKDTAAPLAALRTIMPEAVVDGDPAVIFKKATTEHPDAVILIVGHTNTLPELIAKWGITAPVTVNAGEFDKIFVLIPTGPGQAGLARFRYQPDGP